MSSTCKFLSFLLHKQYFKNNKGHFKNKISPNPTTLRKKAQHFPPLHCSISCFGIVTSAVAVCEFCLVNLPTFESGPGA